MRHGKKVVGLFEAKTHLSALVDRAARGEEITITRRGSAIARLVPARDGERKNPQEAAAAIRRLRKGLTIEAITIRDLIEEGRR